MKVNVLPGTRFHSVPLIQALSEVGSEVRVYSSSPKKNFRISQPFTYRFIPQWNVILERLLPISFSGFELSQNQSYDSLCSFLMRDCDVLHGWAGLSLESGRKTKKAGGKYILERSCPHILFQEKLIEQESEKLQVPYLPKPAWWIERSLQEYEEADYILAPSDYTKRTLIEKGLPASKVKRIPLDYQLKAKLSPQRSSSKEFVVGTVMGNPLRKGLVYLLEAWDQLKLPAAKLLIKMDSRLLDFFPVLQELIQRNPSVTIHDFYPDLSVFYHQCDLFILPSIDDGFGLVINEALAHGIPTIATSHVGAVENYPDQKFLKSLPPQNSQAIAETLEYFFENRQELEYLRMEIEGYLKVAPQARSYFSGIRDLYQTLSFAKPSGFESSKIPT